MQTTMFPLLNYSRQFVTFLFNLYPKQSAPKSRKAHQSLCISAVLPAISTSTAWIYRSIKCIFVIVETAQRDSSPKFEVPAHQTFGHGIDGLSNETQTELRILTLERFHKISLHDRDSYLLLILKFPESPAN